MPGCETVPCVTSLITIAPVPAKTSANVPSDSEKYLFMTRLFWPACSACAPAAVSGECNTSFETRDSTRRLLARPIVSEAVCRRFSETNELQDRLGSIRKAYRPNASSPRSLHNKPICLVCGPGRDLLHAALANVSR